MRKQERRSTPLLLQFNPPRLLWLSGNVRRLLTLGEYNCPRPFESIDLAPDFTGRPIQQNKGAFGKSERCPAIRREVDTFQALIEVNFLERFLRRGVDQMKSIPSDYPENTAVVQRLKALPSGGDLINNCRGAHVDDRHVVGLAIQHIDKSAVRPHGDRRICRRNRENLVGSVADAAI